MINRDAVFSLITAFFVCGIAVPAFAQGAGEAPVKSDFACYYTEPNAPHVPGYADWVKRWRFHYTPPFSASYSHSEYGDLMSRWKEKLKSYLNSKSIPFASVGCDIYNNSYQRERQRNAEMYDYAGETLDWKPQTSAGPVELASAEKRVKLWFKAPNAADAAAEGYNSADISLAYRFLACMGEVHFAYSLDPKSLHCSTNYTLPVSRGFGASVVPDSPPAAPSSIKLKAWIEKYPGMHVAVVEDQFAGPSLGMGCFTGQTRKLGTVAQLIGPSAKPEQIKAYLDALVVKSVNNIPHALIHPNPVNPRLRAEREARERAERAEREAQVRAEKAQLRVQWRKDAEAAYDKMMASGGKTPVAVGPQVYPYLQEVIKERTAQKNAEYEAKMAAWRKATAEAERKKKEWQAEVCRLDATKC